MTVYLFNLAGSSLFIEYLIQKNDAESVNQIDNGNYNNTQLIEMKIPLRLPYYSSSLKYERYYGEIDLDGKYYNYVMRKVLNDTVYLLCLPDYNKADLKTAKAFVGAVAADMQGNMPSKKGADPAGKKQSSLTEYCQQISRFDFRTDFSCLPAWDNMLSMRLSSCFVEPPGKPPRANSGNYNLCL